MNVHVLDLGSFPLDGGALFGVVPRSRWAQMLEADADNRIALAMHAVLIQDGNQRILVDAGTAEAAGRLLEQLSLLQIHPHDITDVVFTHMHYDHSGGAFRSVAGKLQPIFPNAIYHMTEQELNDALAPDERTRHFYNPEPASLISRTGRCRTLTDRCMISSSVELVPAPGHTLGHLAAWVHGPERTLVPGDLVPTTHHLNVHYMTAFDENARLTIQTKKALLKEAALRPTRVVFYHDPQIPAATVEKEGNRYRIRPSA